MKKSFFLLFLFSLLTIGGTLIYDTFEKNLENYKQEIRKSYIVKIEGPFKRTGTYEFSKEKISLAEVLKKVKGFTTSGGNDFVEKKNKESKKSKNGKKKSGRGEKKSLSASKILFDLKNVSTLDLNDLKMGG